MSLPPDGTTQSPRPGDSPPGSDARRPMRSGVRWGRLLVLASVAVLALGLADLGLASRPPGATPAALPSVASTAAPSTAAPSPASVESQVADVEARVPALRDLEPTRAVPNRIVDEAQLRRDIARLFDQENPPARLAAGQALLQRMGLLPSGFDLRSQYVDALGTGVAGYYDEQTREMTIVQRSAAFGPVERLTLAHEFTHALQDMHFGLSSLEGTDTTQGDRALARTALVEGDASLAMARYAQRYLTPADLFAVAVAAGDPAQTRMLDALPPLLRRQLEFPYVDGLQFVSALYARGGWAAVDAAYAKPPGSTAQILHPDLYLAGVEPVSVSLPDVPGALGAGWRESAADTAGEMATGVWLSAVAGSATATTVAAGWAGDRVGSYDGPDGTWAEAWVTAWTSQAAATSFAAAAEPSGPSAPASPLRRVVRGTDPSRVTVVFASDAATLAGLAGAVGR